MNGALCQNLQSPSIATQFLFENQKGFPRLTVAGDSMTPLFAHGSTVEVRPMQRCVRPGRVYVFMRHGTLIAHRYVGRRGEFRRFRGDASRGIEEVTDDAIIGEAMTREHAVQRYAILVVEYLTRLVPRRLSNSVRMRLIRLITRSAQ